VAAPTNHWKLGFFVVVGFVVAMATVVALGARSLKKKTVTYQSYFDESVQGLDVGSPVKFRGVSIGSVATAQAIATSAVDWAAVVRAGAQAWLRTGAIRWTVGLSGLVVMRAARGLDAGRDVTSIEGAGLDASLGGLVAF